MEDRYEIRGKIGQGGLGAVYRAFDSKMNREVAIKRIAKSSLDPSLQEESTLQLIKEASALASLQSPHIVTVYDVGTDDDEPYVVMELITGKTLDEVIQDAPLTWGDFRELALQTQEALIAAQELNLIHSDIKPANVMLNLLPSGKLLVKIVDFGLATLTNTQGRTDLENMDSVFGSIFFMPPEQFERVPLDARSDLYSMGCVYYQALAGLYPYNGTTCHEVMQAHLGHQVRPLRELRPDIPAWACDWIMWHINRQPDDRPDSARESLASFVRNEQNDGLSPTALKRSKLIIPVAVDPGTRLASPTTTPISIKEPSSAGPPTQPMQPSAVPQALAPPPGSKPSVHTSSTKVPVAKTLATALPVVADASGETISETKGPAVQPAKTKLSNSARITIAGVMGLLVLLMAWFLIDRMNQNRANLLYNEMITAAAEEDATEVPVDQTKLELLLTAAGTTGELDQRQAVYRALSLAKASDGTDVDARILEFATTQPMLPDIREVLIREVISARKNSSVVPALLAYAERNAADQRIVVATLKAVRDLALEEHFDALLEILETTGNSDARQAAEDALAQIIGKATSRDEFAKQLASVYRGNKNAAVRHSMLRLLGQCGNSSGIALITQVLAGNDNADRIAAIAALSKWANESALKTLTDFISTTQDPNLRARAIAAVITYLTNSNSGLDTSKTEHYWKQLIPLAKTPDEQIQIINSVALKQGDWISQFLEEFSKSPEANVSDRAVLALQARERELKRMKNQ